MLDFKQVEELVFRCVRCGTCKYVYGSYIPSCPAGDKFSFESYYASGKLFIGQGLFDGSLDLSDVSILDILYACPTCGNCQTQCTLRHSESMVEIYEALRAEAVRRGAGPLPAHRPLISSIKNYNNPWNQPRSSKEKWARRIGGIKDITKDNARVLYFVGCTAALDPTLKDIPLSTVKILKAARVDFGIMGNQEICCGSVALRVGERDVFFRLAEENISILNKLGVDTIITSCAGCYRTLKKDYGDVSKIDAEILHSVEFIERLLNENKLKFTQEIDEKITYHDPCHLARLGGVYDSPRNILNAIPGLEFVEMGRIRENAWCCGAGGGVRSAFPSFASETAVKRIEEATQTNATSIISTCPFCFQNIHSAIQNINSTLNMTDLTSLVCMALP